MFSDEAVFLPGKGAVLVADDQTSAPSVDQIKSWLESGATGDVGDFKPLGYTSLDTLPAIGSETEGGEVKGVWENRQLRTTAVTTTDTIDVSPVQWTEVPLRHRFGNADVDPESGKFVVPKAYVASNVALLVVFIDGEHFLAVHVSRAATSPNGSIEADPENFLALPVRYTVLTPQSGDRMTILSDALQSSEASGPEEEEDSEPVPGAPRL